MAEAPQSTLKVETGKFYRAETGEKVGPMELWWTSDICHPWQQAGNPAAFDPNGDLWKDDGTSDFACPRLVAEWSDDASPALAQSGES